MELTLSELTGLLQATAGTTPRSDGVVDAHIVEPVIVRTVTHYYVGNLVKEDDRWLYLDDCSWIADTGRWSTALGTGVLNEVEPYPSGVIVRIAIGAVVDVAAWQHDLPRSVK